MGPMGFVSLVLLAAFADQQLPGPSKRSEFPTWITKMQATRDKDRQKYNYSGELYHIAALKWTQTSYIQPQMHTYDRFFYDPVTKKYTVDKYLDDLTTRFGGIDSMLVWHTYTNIGIDDRNQYELTESMPGHVRGFRAVVDELHKRGVKVLFPFNPWDQGTHPAAKSDPIALASMIVSMQGDGFNGDTMDFVSKDFFDASLAAGYPLAIEPEIGGDFRSASWTPMGWGYWNLPYVPMVDAYKWLDSRRLTHVCNRWSTNHNEELLAAWFNGDGFESWENVWGVWNGLTKRNSEEIRRVAAMLRFFGGRGFLQSPDWEPHTPVISQSSLVYASKWPLGKNTFYSFVNLDTKDAVGPHLDISPFPTGTKFFDGYHGTPLTPTVNNTLAFRIEALGYGAVYATPDAPDAAFLAHLDKMKNMTAQPLSSFSQKWNPLPQQVVPIPHTAVPTSTPTDMVLVGPAKNWYFQVCSIEIEGDELPTAIGVQMPWESHPSRCHKSKLNVTQLYMDKFPTTNAQWAAFVAETHYAPLDPWNYLRHWPNGTMRAGWGNKPVVWVSLDEARAYCKWAGKRLPQVWEWQLAAQGTDGRIFPWGNNECTTCVPRKNSGRAVPPQDDVDAHPTGGSPFGVQDMVGNVWQWTSEFQDDHTRTAALRGGSNYRPSGSEWYLPQAVRNDQMQKYTLFDDSYDRAGTIGFRCVVDAAQPAPPCEQTGLCLSVSYAHSDEVMLSREGEVDWVHLGRNGDPLLTSRKAGANIIGEVILGGSIKPQLQSKGSLLYLWEEEEEEEEKGLQSSAGAGGLEWSFETESGGGLDAATDVAVVSLAIPAKQSWMVARVYLSAFGLARGLLRAELGESVVEMQISAGARHSFLGVYNVKFKGAEGQTLSLSVTALGDHLMPRQGSLALEAITLALA